MLGVGNAESLKGLWSCADHKASLPIAPEQFLRWKSNETANGPTNDTICDARPLWSEATKAMASFCWIVRGWEWD